MVTWVLPMLPTKIKRMTIIPRQLVRFYRCFSVQLGVTLEATGHAEDCKSEMSARIIEAF
jgi:hypothetical protein